MRLSVVHWKNQLSSFFYYVLGAVLLLENLQEGLKRWRFAQLSEQAARAGIADFSIEWSLWSASYSGGIFLLLWGIWIFTQTNYPRSNGLLKILYCKPLPYHQAVQGQLRALALGGSLLTTVALWSSNLALLIFEPQYRPGVLWFVLPPLLSMGIGIACYTVYLYALSLLSGDWRVFVPLHFVSWVVLFSLGGINVNYKELTNLKNPLLDAALYQNRLLVCLTATALTLLIGWIAGRQQQGRFIWPPRRVGHGSEEEDSSVERGVNQTNADFNSVKPGRKQNHSATETARSTAKAIKLFSAKIARLRYALKVYYGWRLVAAIASGLILGGLYAWKLSADNLYRPDFIVTLAGQSLISLLGLMTTLQLANLENQYGLLKLMKTLPGGGVQTLRDKMLALAVYFLLLCCSFLLPLCFIPRAVIWQSYVLALVPPFLFLTGVSYLVIQLTRKTYLGYALGGALWLGFLTLERRIPYWLQPFYEIAEYRFTTLTPFWINKSIITGLGFTCFLLIFFLEYRRLQRPLKGGRVCK